jgi:hypothetical protein
MPLQKCVFIFPAILIAVSGFGQNTKTANGSAANLIGTWKGTSICQVKPSPCNDEIAMYHITKEIKPGIYHMVMNKVVNGKEEDMGVGDYSFSVADNSLTYVDEKRNFMVKLTIKRNMMEGSMVVKNVIYRIIKLEKAAE